MWKQDMLQFRVFGIKVRLSFLFFAVTTIYLILDRTGYGYCGILAAVTHELGHVIAYFLVGERPKSVSLSIEGMRITQSERYLTLGKDLFALSAGCMVNFCAFFLLYYGIGPDPAWTQIALVQLSIGLFNLIPVAALDGGMILKRIFTAVLSLKAATVICKTISWCVVLPMLVISLVLLFRSRNFTLLVTTGFLILSLVQDNHI